MESNSEVNGPLYLNQVPHTIFPKRSLNATHINHEEYRIRTFKSWPIQGPIQPDRLAKAGFYYLGNGLEVVCFSCGGKISDWTYGDIAMQKHCQMFPGCDFVNGTSDNVPIVKRIQESESQNVITNGHCNHFSQLSLEHPGPGCSMDSPEVCVPNVFTYGNGSRPILQKPRVGQIGTQPYPKDIQSMRYEHERLKTFIGRWPCIFIHPVDLARAGFFYQGIADKVQCPFCLGVLTNWEPGDKPHIEHMKNFPTCPFVTGRNVGNIPSGEDTCGSNYPQANEIRWMLNSAPERKRSTFLQDCEQIGVNPHTGPQHPSQASRDARLRSFLSWPQHSPAKGEDLAEAGFFYIGMHDNVKCFSCDGGLSNWEPGDDPWVEHARWFPTCAFVKLNKGANFIKECLARGQNSPKRKAVTPGTERLFVAQGSQSSNSDPEGSSEDIAQVNLALSPLDVQVEEEMQSNLVQAFLRANAYPPPVVRLAVLHKIQTTGSSVHDVDELCEAIHASRSNPVALYRMDSENEGEKDMEQVMKEAIPEVPKLVFQKLPTPLELKSEMTLEEENRQLKEQRLCKICMDQDVGVVFLPCGHLIACVQCAPALTDCALCRSPIKGTIRTFLS